MKADKKMYLTLLISLLLTGLVIFDGTSIWIAIITVTMPIVASYWLVVRFNGVGMVLVPILWALSVFARSYFTGTLTSETLKIVSVKAFGSVILALGYVAFTRNK